MVKDHLTVAGFILVLAAGSLVWGQAAGSDASKTKAPAPPPTPAASSPTTSPITHPTTNSSPSPFHPSSGPEPGKIGGIGAPGPLVHLPPHPIRDPGPRELKPVKKDEAEPKALSATKQAELDAELPRFRRTPIVTWADPAPIKQGQPLTGRELDAIPNVSGTLIYSPGPGYVPPRGSCTLTVHFIPTDSQRYHSTSTTAVLEVE